ncbi:DEAD/DEAH box helicase, partial [Clostridium botulinum]
VLELGEDDITAANAAVLTNKLLQMSNGAIYSEDKQVIEIHDEKLKALLDIIESANGKPVLIFYSFKHDFDRIVNFFKSKKLNAIGLGDSKDIKKWNNGEIPILLVHPASAGHGLNLQYGGNIIVWFGLTWSLELYQQANARLHRQGQKESVIIHHLVSKDTVDEDVIKTLGSKEVNQNVLLEAVKARLKTYKEV